MPGSNWLYVRYLAFIVFSCNIPIGTSTITINDGEIRGSSETVDNVTIYKYLGIPYAEPPVGNLRFRRPRPVKPWQGVLDALTLPNTCFQVIDPLTARSPAAQVWLPNTKLSEDCLYLNVWTPARENETNSSRAVMVWIYGGGFVSGTSTSDMYNGRILASQYDVVVVSMQYRLGPLGFLYFGVEEAPGNMGLLDQQLALKWVASNIRSFGGDPDRVTLFGESAGSASVGYHLLSPGSANLFRNGILQSGAPRSLWGYREPKLAKEAAKKYAKEAGCTQSGDAQILKCLKSKKLDQLGKLWTTILPTNDGVLINKSPMALLAQGAFKPTRIILGVTADEMGLGILLSYPQLMNSSASYNFSKEDFNQLLSTYIMPSFYSDEVIKAATQHAYSLENMEGAGSYLRLAIDVWGDSFIICDAVDFADHYARKGNNVYMYILDHWNQNSPWPEKAGSVHGSDIMYVFGNGNFSAQDDPLRRRIQSYWTSFAKTGSPDGAGSGTWPPYIGPAHTSRVLDLQPNHVENNVLTKRCAFWNKLVPKLLEIRDKEKSNDNCETSKAAVTIVSPLLLPLFGVLATILFTATAM